MSFRCATCDLTLNSRGQFEQHMTGKSHAKKLKKIAANGQDPTKPQAKQINFVRSAGDQLTQGTPATGTQPPSSCPDPSQQQQQPTSGDGGEDNTYCGLCMIKLNSKEQARIHYGGTKHLRKLKVAQQYYTDGGPTPPDVAPVAADSGAKKGLFFCGFCNITVNSALQMTLHRDGAKHKRMVEGMKRHATDGDTNGPAAKRPAMASPQGNPGQGVPCDMVRGVGVGVVGG
ncbi:zinc finger protein 346-like [Babylonia areolata]|uniref:zinc finger protein 346-like n=1 Tax=Babylonia areolata TaxID=304850 RepID=UPI003FD50761